MRGDSPTASPRILFGAVSCRFVAATDALDSTKRRVTDRHRPRRARLALRLDPFLVWRLGYERWVRGERRLLRRRLSHPKGGDRI
jgi:hypothetical protein